MKNDLIDRQVLLQQSIIIENEENIVPGVTQPLSIACTQNGLAVLEETSCKLFNEATQEVIAIKQLTAAGFARRLSHMAVNKQGTKVAAMSNDYLCVNSAITGEREWLKPIPLGNVIPILFEPQDESRVLCYTKAGSLSVESQNRSERMKTIAPLLQANRLFAVHPTEREIVYGASGTEYHWTHYEKVMNVSMGP